MCVIVDTNSLAAVFKESCALHGEFEPVFRWIMRGRGRVVYGGSKYQKELSGAASYLRVFVELRKAGKAIKMDDATVDETQRGLEARTRAVGFNDAHIVALVIVADSFAQTIASHTLSLQTERCIHRVSSQLESTGGVRTKSYCPVGK
jgi:hypothetical protein